MRFHFSTNNGKDFDNVCNLSFLKIEREKETNENPQNNVSKFNHLKKIYIH